MKRRSITTRAGDSGKTYLFSGESVDKDDPRTDAYGDLDELVSVLGVAYAHMTDLRLCSRIQDVQETLFIVGSELATSLHCVESLPCRIGFEQVAEMDEVCRLLEEAICAPTGFVLPGGSVAAAHLDHARTLVRRLERKVVALQRSGIVGNDLMLVWLNRLSDYLWLLARCEEGDATRVKDQ